MCLLAPLHTQLAGYVHLFHMSWNTAKQISITMTGYNLLGYDNVPPLSHFSTTGIYDKHLSSACDTNQRNLFIYVSSQDLCLTSRWVMCVCPISVICYVEWPIIWTVVNPPQWLQKYLASVHKCECLPNKLLTETVEMFVTLSDQLYELQEIHHNDHKSFWKVCPNLNVCQKSTYRNSITIMHLPPCTMHTYWCICQKHPSWECDWYTLTNAVEGRNMLPPCSGE